MTKEYVGYTISIMESEAGWGQKPDGHIIAISAEALEAKVKEVEDAGDYNIYWRTVGVSGLVILSEEGYQELNADDKGAFWVNSLKDFVK